jgi:hypothetical protein
VHYYSPAADHKNTPNGIESAGGPRAGVYFWATVLTRTVSESKAAAGVYLFLHLSCADARINSCNIEIINNLIPKGRKQQCLIIFFVHHLQTHTHTHTNSRVVSFKANHPLLYNILYTNTTSINDNVIYVEATLSPSSSGSNISRSCAV